MQNGRFTFMYIGVKLRKMVLTTSNGTQISAGYLQKDVNNWRNESTWHSDFYEISNFQGIMASRSSSLLCNDLDFQCNTVETLYRKLYSE